MGYRRWGAFATGVVMMSVGMVLAAVSLIRLDLLAAGDDRGNALALPFGGAAIPGVRLRDVLTKIGGSPRLMFDGYHATLVIAAGQRLDASITPAADPGVHAVSCHYAADRPADARVRHKAESCVYAATPDAFLALVKAWLTAATVSSARTFAGFEVRVDGDSDYLAITIVGVS